MASSFLLLTLVLTQGQAPDRSAVALVPQFTQGLELVYRGVCTEEALVPGVQYQRQYRLETTLFVHDGDPKQWEIALQTTVSAIDPKDDKKEPAPGSVRLELGQLDRQGRLRGVGLVPLTGPPTIDPGILVEVPLHRVAVNDFWETTEAGRPPRTWMITGSEPRDGLTCLKLVGQQQSDDWDRPRADTAAWRRKEIVWFAPQLGLVTRLERTIERRDPARKDPTQRIVAQYELDSRLKYPGRLFEDRQRDIEKHHKFQEEATPLYKNPQAHRFAIEHLLKRVTHHLETTAPTPYRKALVYLQSRLELARNGQVPAEVAVDETPTIKGPVLIGQRVPDFVVTDLTTSQSIRLYRLLGKPILVVYYNPATETGKEVLTHLRRMYDKHSQNLGILAMAATEDVELAKKQHVALRLPFAVHDGKAMHHTFGVDGTPRVILLDGDAVVRTAFTGWGAQSIGEIEEELQRCLSK